MRLHLEKAYQNFFGNPAVGYPKYKAKHRGRQSYTTNVVNGNIRVEEGKYYASLLYTYENQVRKQEGKPEKILGVDFAMSGLGVFSDGTRAEYLAECYMRDGTKI